VAETVAISGGIEMRCLKGLLLALLTTLICSSRALSQANVNEGLETAYIYVDQANGNDNNPGTITQPLQTIGAAVTMAETNNASSVGSRVIINPGIYREAVTVAPLQNGTSLPITFEAALTGTATVSGADVWTGWQPYSANPNIYTTSWPYAWGLCTPAATGPQQADIVLRREMVFVNSTMLTQVLSYSEVTAGTFYVDEAGGTIYVWPPLGTNMYSATVEVSTRPQIWTVQNQSNIVARGLTFEYGNPCWGNGAVQVIQGSPTNILFDTDNFEWNNAEGLQLWNGTADYTIENSTATHNGESGFAVYEVKNGMFQSVASGLNNWRGAQGAYYGWNASGFHFTGDHTDQLYNLQTYYNQSQGLHYDTDNQHITLNGFASNNDLNVGLMFEITQGPVTITNATVCAGSPLAYTAYAALGLRDSEGISISNSNFMGAPTDVGLVETPGGTWVTNWETNQQTLLFTENFSLTQSVMQAGNGQDLFAGGTLVPSEWSDFQSTLTSNNNTWWNSANNMTFNMPVSGNNTTVDFAGWQSNTGQDTNSAWAAPSGNPGAACTGAPDMVDFWFLVPDGISPLAVPVNTPAVFAANLVPILNFNGTAQLSYDGVQYIPGATASWSQNTLGPNQSANFTVTPGSTTPVGTYPIVLIATSGSLTHTITVLLTVDGAVTLSSSSLNFGNQVIRTPSASQSVVVTNTGGQTLTGISVSINGGNSIDFTQTNNCPSSLPANSSCTINVTFTPNATGNATSTLNIYDSAPSSPQQVALSGTGTQPTASLTPSSLNFGNQTVGVVSPAQTITLTNSGTATLSITSIVLGGTNASDYAEINNCGTSLAVNASCTINVTFDPLRTGTRSAKITVTDNATPTTQITTLTGTGTQSKGTLSMSSQNFKSQVWEETSATQTFTLTNAGASTMNFTGIALTGANATDFAQTNNCGSSLAANATCTINVTFTPTALGTRNAAVTFTSNASNSPQSETLTGTGTSSVSYTPKTLNFGSHKVGKSSNPINVTVTNLGTTQTLSISSIGITGSDAGDFTQTNTCGSSLGPGKNCTISVIFTPGQTGTRSAAVDNSNNDPASPQTVSVAGSGN
jgi:hypothetical protein